MIGRRLPVPLAGIVLVASLATEMRAVQPRLHVPPPFDLQRGDAEGVAVTSLGRIFLSPNVAPLVAGTLAGSPSGVWAATTDLSGNLYLGTGPGGAIVRVTPTGQSSVFFVTDETLVTALAVLPGGDLVAGTSPEGKIYRIAPSGKGRLWVETEERYVWSLAIGSDGALYAGTGEHGVVVRIDTQGNPTPFFDSDEAHIMALAPLPGGGFVAAGAGRGLVYKLDAEGHGIVLYDDDLPEIRDLVVEPGGGIVAVAIASPEPERRLPAVRIQVAGGAEIGPSNERIVDRDDRQGATLQGVIQGLPDYADDGSKRLRGRIVRIAPDGAVAELWRSTSESPFAVTLDGDGRVVFGTGEPARLYRVEREGETALLATLREAQVTRLLRSSKGPIVATSNPAAGYRLDRSTPASGTFLARPIDAGGAARWGAFRWRQEGRPGGVEFFTRTGNSADPDGTWSAWSPALTDPESSASPNPEGRFLQWRVRLIGAGEESGRRIASAAVAYVTRNRAPSVKDFRLDPPGTSVASKAAFKWSVSDPDGDPVAVDVEFRKPGEAAWSTAFHVDPPALKPGESTLENEGVSKDGKGTWDASAAAEGPYEIRVTASDQAWNAPGDGRSSSMDLDGLLVVDRTPPVLEAKRIAGGAVEVVARDGMSSVARLEVLGDGKVLFVARPEDGVCDSKRESFRLSGEQAGSPGTRILRVVDVSGNSADSPVPGP